MPFLQITKRSEASTSPIQQDPSTARRTQQQDGHPTNHLPAPPHHLLSSPSFHPPRMQPAKRHIRRGKRKAKDVISHHNFLTVLLLRYTKTEPTPHSTRVKTKRNPKKRLAKPHNRATCCQTPFLLTGGRREEEGGCVRANRTGKHPLYVPPPDEPPPFSVRPASLFVLAYPES